MSGVPLRVMLELREDIAARELLLAFGAVIDELVATKALGPSQALQVFNKHKLDIVRRPESYGENT